MPRPAPKFKWSDSFSQIMAKTYQQLGVPSDQIATSPAEQAKFAEAFRANLSFPSDDTAIVKKLILLRKQGKLPKLGRPAKK